MKKNIRINSTSYLLYLLLVCCYHFVGIQYALSASQEGDGMPSKTDKQIVRYLVKKFNSGRVYQANTLRLKKRVHNAREAAEAFEIFIAQKETTVNFGQAPALSVVGQINQYYFSQITNSKLSCYIIVKKRGRWVFFDGIIP